MTDAGRLIIVSNRLPLVMNRGDDGWTAAPGDGGLVTALAPVLRDRGGTWIGWPGTTEPPGSELRESISSAVSETGYNLVPVFLDEREKKLYYHGTTTVFAKRILSEGFVCSPKKLQKATGFTAQVNLNEGLGRTHAWYTCDRNALEAR